MASALVTLKKQTKSGQSLEASFHPQQGMNLQSYRCDGVEVIDQSTQPLFEERSAGLGAMIGPHFHRRNTHILPSISDESLFPHIARVKAKGVQDPFSHGIGRYAPWKEEHTDSSISATLSGKDEWNGVPLADLQGMDFKMSFNASLEDEGLRIHLSVVSESDSLVGIHYYYRLPEGKATVRSQVQSSYRDQDEYKDIPKAWCDGEGSLAFCLSQEADYGFQRDIRPVGSEIVLDTAEYSLKTVYDCGNAENSWQLYHPAKSSFVCIEPLSAANPRKPQLSVSNLDILLTVVPKSR